MTNRDHANQWARAVCLIYWGNCPEHQRVMEISSSQGTTLYLNPGNSGELAFEKDHRIDDSIEQRNFITAYGQVVAVVKQTQSSGNTTNSVRYFHRDNFGSISNRGTDHSSASILASWCWRHAV